MQMTPRHVALAFLVVAVWGTNFVVAKIALRAIPPFLFVLLRFVFCAVPFVFLLPRPRTPWRWLAVYGAVLGAGQFGLLFYAMGEAISPGLASLVIQAQVFFTIALSAWLFRERVTAMAIAGCTIAVAGFALIASRLDASATPLGVAMVLGAALSRAIANNAGKKAVAEAAAPFTMLPFIAWASLFAIPPLLFLTLALEGPQVAWHAMRDASAWDWLAVAWQVVGNTLLGFGVWSFLLSRYDAAVVSPWALLIPVFGMASSALFLGEPLPAWKVAGAALVLAGLAMIVFFGTRRR
jgi:O-acetylserine/cysteine efflux transporter